MSRICLVACASSKLDHNAPAGELYVSALFEKSRTWAMRFCDRWYILSAKYGLLDPNDVIEPYNVTLNNLGIDARKRWSAEVLKALLAQTTPEDQITFLAGIKYREYLEKNLKFRGYKIEAPLEGLAIGLQLQWLIRQLS